MEVSAKKIAKDYLRHCIRGGNFEAAESFVLGLFIAGGISQAQHKAVLRCINKGRKG